MMAVRKWMLKQALKANFVEYERETCGGVYTETNEMWYLV
jgi:hypothetical protein